jgi:hypothetical protein
MPSKAGPEQGPQALDGVFAESTKLRYACGDLAGASIHLAENKGGKDIERK